MLKKSLILILFLILALSSYFFLTSPKNISRELTFNPQKTISLEDGGLNFELQTTTNNIQELLQEKKINLTANDWIFPEKSTSILPGMHVRILRAIKIKILVDGKTLENYTLQNNIPDILAENNISLGRLDKVEPNINTPPQKDMQILITRINVEEKIIPEDIAFKTITNSDAKMSWREEKITQPGEKGVLEVKYKITYKNNKEVSRVALEKNISKEPVTQVTTKGTHIELGRAAKGQGTWYAYVGGLFAASTSIPKGSYAKVTNTANGKSVIVQINDYGPQGKGRIIDLDKVAFTKIASLGAGVIGVKVEPVLN